MVGTFYASSSPEADAYVKVGDHVTDESVVCVIEAMKVFNEIRSETSGTVEKILVKNATPVEFGQPLFAVRPD
jgi:acetyl-CoA carboxylase biotin carboxyl carrier protein